MPKKNTRLEAEGAEFLVLGHLLVEGLQAYKMYTNMPGYDVLVVNPEATPNRTAKVSVKSRWKASAGGIIINNFDSDFVVVAKLNGDINQAPQFYIIPTIEISELKRSGWGKVNFSAIPNFPSYLGAWHRIREFVGISPPAEPEEEFQIDD
jgi:hypothetical protein